MPVGGARADVAGTVQRLRPESVSESAVVGSASTHAASQVLLVCTLTGADCAEVRATSRAWRPAVVAGDRTSPARPWSRRRSDLPAPSERGYALHVMPFGPEPSDGARLDVL